MRLAVIFLLTSEIGFCMHKEPYYQNWHQKDLGHIAGRSRFTHHEKSKSASHINPPHLQFHYKSDKATRLRTEFPINCDIPLRNLSKDRKYSKNATLNLRHQPHKRKSSLRHPSRTERLQDESPDKYEFNFNEISKAVDFISSNNPKGAVNYCHETAKCIESNVWSIIEEGYGGIQNPTASDFLKYLSFIEELYHQRRRNEWLAPIFSLFTQLKRKSILFSRPEVFEIGYFIYTFISRASLDPKANNLLKLFTKHQLPKGVKYYSDTGNVGLRLCDRVDGNNKIAILGYVEFGRGGTVASEYFMHTYSEQYLMIPDSLWIPQRKGAFLYGLKNGKDGKYLECPCQNCKTDTTIRKYYPNGTNNYLSGSENLYEWTPYLGEEGSKPYIGFKEITTGYFPIFDTRGPFDIKNYTPDIIKGSKSFTVCNIEEPLPWSD